MGTALRGHGSGRCGREPQSALLVGLALGGGADRDGLQPAVLGPTESGPATGAGMPLSAVTHSGPFHADDVLAWGLLQVFVDADATLVRTRDAAVMADADVVFDVGGVYDPATGRFDHHQQSYEGPLSSAGMVLDWLESTGKMVPALAQRLRSRLVDYVDDVDNGRREPDPAVPCFASMVEAYNRGLDGTLPGFDTAFFRAGEVARGLVAGIAAGYEEEAAAEAVVKAAMADAEARQSNVIYLHEYVRWKPAYYRLGGETHPTEFVVAPGPDGSWRAFAIPPRLGSFAQKVPLPEAWAGLVDEELEAVTGVAGARFCHKNRFIMVFNTKAGLFEALQTGGIARGALPPL